MATVLVLPVEVIEENPQALRSTVNKDSLAYQELKAGIEEVGLLNPISVREYTKDDGSVGYRLVDGLHRLSACTELGYTTIPVNVVSIDDSKLLVAQIIGNNNVKTTKTQFAQALKQLIQHEGWTVKEVAARVKRTEKWVSDQLGLLDLPESVQKLVDEGKVCVLNALSLRKIKDNFDDYLQAAMTEPPTIFGPKVEEALKEARSSALKGEKHVATFKVLPKLRKPGEIKAVFTEAEATGTSSVLKAMLETQGITDPLAAAIATVKYMLHMDPASVAAEKALWDANQAQKAENARKREEEKRLKKEAQAAADVKATLAA